MFSCRAALSVFPALARHPDPPKAERDLPVIFALNIRSIGLSFYLYTIKSCFLEEILP